MDTANTENDAVNKISKSGNNFSQIVNSQSFVHQIGCLFLHMNKVIRKCKNIFQHLHNCFKK